MSEFCGQCGAAMAPGVKFCPSCGAAAVANAPQAAIPVPAQPAAPIAAPVPPSQTPPPASATSAQPETEWHYATGGVTKGPLTESALRALLPSLPADVTVWNPSLPSWQAPEQAGLRRAAPAPPFGYSASPYAPPAYAPVAGSSVATYPGYPQPGYPAQIPYGMPGVLPGGFAGSPTPPDMHWFLVIVLTVITFGLFILFWAFRQASFVKKIDPASKAASLLALTVLGVVAQVGLVYASVGASANVMQQISTAVLILSIALFVVEMVLIFGMRKSMVTYYNSVEPIGLQLSGIMTFFFNILYFQYHFSRIANWKRTGILG